MSHASTLLSNHGPQLQALIANDPTRMQILRQVHGLGLPDCWVAAGFVRSVVWDHLHHRSPSPLPEDIDVVWYGPDQATPAVDRQLEAALRALDNGLNWSVKNQARMHLRNHDRPYTCTADAMTHWPETATAVGVRLGPTGNIEIAAPFGLEDLFALVVRPTPRFIAGKYTMFQARHCAKGWIERWPDLIIDPQR